MVPSGLLLATLLVAQAPAAAAPPTSTVPIKSPLVSVQEPLAEDAPEKLIAEAIEPTDHDALTGEPQTLLAVLSRMGPDRDRQLRAIVAYWQLTADVAEYHFRQLEVDYLRQLEGFESSASAGAGPEQPKGDPLRIAAADARRGEAQLDAIVAQHALAAWEGVPASTPLPLPVDRPHVNAYRTYYQQLFPSGGSLSLQRIDATLPVRRQEIAIRARAIRRAEQALSIAENGYIANNGPRREVLECLDRLSNERTQFVEAVRKYNIEIGEYAVTVARPGAGASDLVAMMLIDYVPPSQTLPAAGFVPSTSTPGAVPQPGAIPAGGYNQPATYNNPVTVPLTPARQQLPGSVPIRYGEPTLAPPQESLEAASESEPTLIPDAAKDAEGWRSSDDEVPANQTGPAEPAELDVPTEASPIPAPPTELDQSLPEEDVEEPQDDSQQVLYAPESESVAEVAIPRGTSLDITQYRELGVEAPKIRAQRLAQWTEVEPSEADPATTPPTTGLRAVTLAECLDRNTISQRADTVATYWHAWAAARTVAIRTWQVEQVEAVIKATGSQAGEGDARGEQLQLAFESAEADRLQAIAELEAARVALVSRLSNWPAGVLPAIASPPHAGGYNMKASTQQPEISGTRDFHRLIDSIPRWHEIVVDSTTAVLDAHADRARAISGLTPNSKQLDVVIIAIERQATEELYFTQCVAEYNTSISRYVDLVVPSTVSTDVFLKASVLRR